MSRGQLARTPENFPRMKHRAAARLARREVVRIISAVEVIGRVGKAIRQAFEPIMDAVRRIAEAFNALPALSDFALVDGPRFPPMTMLVSPQRQAEIDAIRFRSHELAVQRGHIRRYP